MYMKNLEPQQALLREINHSNMFSQVYSQLPSLPTERIDCDFHASVIDRYGKDTNKQCKSKYEKLVILHVSKKETQKQTSITKSLCRVQSSLGTQPGSFHAVHCTAACHTQADLYVGFDLLGIQSFAMALLQTREKNNSGNTWFPIYTLCSSKKYIHLYKKK